MSRVIVVPRLPPFDQAGSSEESEGASPSSTSSTAELEAEDVSPGSTLLRLRVMGDAPSAASSPAPSPAFPRFVIPRLAQAQAQSVDSLTRRMSASAPERTPAAAAPNLLVRLGQHVAKDPNQANRVCTKCNHRHTMVPWILPHTLQCMAPSISPTNGGVTVTCGHLVHTQLNPQLCPTAKCRGGMMQVERHFGQVGYACRECRHFETLDDVQTRLTQELERSEKERQARLAQEEKKRQELLVHAEKKKRRKAAASARDKKR